MSRRRSQDLLADGRRVTVYFKRIGTCQCLAPGDQSLYVYEADDPALQRVVGEQRCLSCWVCILAGAFRCDVRLAPSATAQAEQPPPPSAASATADAAFLQWAQSIQAARTALRVAIDTGAVTMPLRTRTVIEDLANEALYILATRRKEK